MEAFKQLAMGVAGLAGSALATYMLQGGGGSYNAASKVFATRGGDVVKTNPILSSLTNSENAETLKALSTAKTREEKLNLAVQVFLGFWMVNGDARGDLCRQSGVDFTTFVEKFERRNARQHAKAVSYLEAAGLSEERLYKSRRDDFTKKLRLQMLYMGSGQAMQTEDACRMMLIDAERYVGKLDFRILEPNLNQILLGS